MTDRTTIQRFQVGLTVAAAVMLSASVFLLLFALGR